MKYDYIIVGQGLAGSVLGLTLLKNNKKILILDDNLRPAASKIAAGLYNPITGMRLVKTWEADIIFPFLINFYSEMEKILDAKFFFPASIYHPFDSIEIQNDWMARTERQDLKRYILPKSDNIPEGLLHHPLGGISGNFSGFIDVKLFVECCKEGFIKEDIYRNDIFDFNDLKVSEDQINYKNYKADKIIFCEGIYVLNNPYFNFLPFKYVKGEILTLAINDIKLNTIINKGVYLLQTNNGDFKLGATYDWNLNDWNITEGGKIELVEKLNKFIIKPYQIINHQAGVRPASLDRRPIIGLHPTYKNMGIFNGLGTKGVSLAPYFAHEFVQLLENGKEMNKEVQIQRFFR